MLGTGVMGAWRGVESLCWDQLEPTASRTSLQVCTSGGLCAWQVSAGQQETELACAKRMGSSPRPRKETCQVDGGLSLAITTMV